MPLPFLVLPFCVSVQIFVHLTETFLGCSGLPSIMGVEFSQYPELLTVHQDVMDQKCAVMSTFMCMHI
jgi:hypothetical protein